MQILLPKTHFFWAPSNESSTQDKVEWRWKMEKKPQLIANVIIATTVTKTTTFLHNILPCIQQILMPNSPTTNE